MNSCAAAATGSPPGGAGQGMAVPGAPWWWEHPLASTDLPAILEITLPVGAAPPRHDNDSRSATAGPAGGRGGGCRGGTTRLRRPGPGQWHRTPAAGAARVPGDRRGWPGCSPCRRMQLRRACPGSRRARGARELPPPGAGPGLEDRSRSMAEHDVIVVGPSMTQKEARALAGPSRLTPAGAPGPPGPPAPPGPATATGWVRVRARSCQQALDVLLDRPGGQEQPGRDVLAPQALGDQADTSASGR